MKNNSSGPTDSLEEGPKLVRLGGNKNGRG